MNVAIDAVGIRMGGGARVLCDLIELLPEYRPEWNWAVYVLPEAKRMFALPNVGQRVEFVPIPIGDHPVGRIVWVNHLLSRVLKKRKSEVLGRLFAAGAAASAQVIVQTEAVKEVLIRKFPLLASLTRTIPSAVNRRSQEGPVRPSIKEAVDRARRPRLFYPAYSYAHKNHTRLMSLYSELLNSVPSCALFLTLDQPGTQKSSYETRLDLEGVHLCARKHGVADKIGWLGSLSGPEVAYVLRNVDAMIFPSLRESFGLPLAEAMLHECPIAAADLPYAREIAAQAAVYFPPLDPLRAAGIVSALLNDQAQLEYLRMTLGRQ